MPHRTASRKLSCSFSLALSLSLSLSLSARPPLRFSSLSSLSVYGFNLSLLLEAAPLASAVTLFQMPESKALVGLSWEPKIPNFSSATKTGLGFDAKPQETPRQTNHLWKPATELVDGLFVPPNNPKTLNKMRRKQLKDTTGLNWFDMPAPTMTPELQRDLQLLNLRSVMDPKRHYKKGDSQPAKYFQVGTVVESPSDFFSGRLTKKERKATIAEELLSDPALATYRKRKVREIEEKNRPAGNEKWKNKGKMSYKRAKQRRL